MHGEWTMVGHYWPKVPRGWTLMNYERNGKPVCRYFYTSGG
jgi:hypothetical protein